jgi:LuxR family transcriptional regulator, maltose regulon positive regulatory protein
MVGPHPTASAEGELPMASPWVATKVNVPRLRRGIVDRPRLTERLARATETRLTLVSAPAGFGKSTAVTAWLEPRVKEGAAVAWVSLDDSDSQPGSFWTYVVLALQKVVPDVGGAVLQALESGQPPSTDLIAALVNDLSRQPVDIDLVLDDYHLADGPDVAAGMAYLLDHLPPHVHVVLTTRADPDLPLSRLRARGELVEVRARDLRFNVEEATQYLSTSGAPALTGPDVAKLTQRTEGWAAALQLAALSMQGRDDVDGFVAGFTGTDRYIVDYLADEVLARQPDEVRTFLLRTCVLDRLSGDLCDWVSGAGGGRAMLELLYRENLFVVAMDDQRLWYRYHHLFADVLQAHLLESSPHLLPLLHERASTWYGDRGDFAAAVRHALIAGDVQRAADVAERAAPLLERERREAIVRGWADDFPHDVVRQRPVLAVALIGGLMRANDFTAVDSRLTDVERWLPAIHERLSHVPAVPVESATDPSSMVVVDETELARVPAAIHMYRAALALVEGDPVTTINRAQQAVEAAPPDDRTIPASASALSGLACWATGDLNQAHDQYETSIAHLNRAGYYSDVLGCTIALADLRITQGRLTEARHAYEEGLRLGGDDPAGLRGVADMHAGLAEISLERGDTRRARDHLASARELGEPLGLPQFPYRWRAASAVFAEADGDPYTALELLTDAERVYVGDFSPDVRPLHARKARIHASLGDVDECARWTAAHRVTLGQPLTYALEFQHVTLAQVLLADHRHRGDAKDLVAARSLLLRLSAATEAGGRRGTLIDVLVLQALAADDAGDEATALALWERAVTIAEPEQHIRPFARHGSALASLVARSAHLRTTSPFWEHLEPAVQPTSGGRTTSSRRPASDAVGPLSMRETEILRLLATDLDGPEIARHLVVSLHTVRTHTKNVYAKLGVNSRRAAVSRAQELGLLSTR